MDRQMKGEYFKMKNHGLRRIFSLLLALFMVFTLLPTTAFAEGTTEPKPIGAEDGKQEPKPDEGPQPAGETPDKPNDEDPPAPEDPKTFTVTYTDGVKGEEVFADVVYKDIPYGTNTPAFGTKDPTRKGYKFLGWEPAVAETVTGDVTYDAKWEAVKKMLHLDSLAP